MNKKVIVSIRGLQFMNESEEAVEVITIGEYYQRNGKHYLLFEEMVEGIDGVVRNIIKFNENMVDITKSGAANVHMIFQEKQKNLTYYDTPFGNLLIGLRANQIKLYESEEAIDVKIDYSLDINYEFISECTIVISVKDRSNGEIKLQ